MQRLSHFLSMEHATGIEPARLAWEAKVRRPSVRQTDALPAELNTHTWCRLQELNPQLADYDSATLPIELSRQDNSFQVALI